MKRSIALTLLAPLLAVAACGGGGSGSGSSGGAPSSGDLAAQCPVGALAKAASKPVQITLWHSMTRVNEDTLKELTDEFNASQTDIHVNLVNQTSYEDTLTKFKAALGGGDLPDLVQIQDVDQQLVIDSQAMLPAQACIDAEHVDQSAILPRIKSYYTVQGVQWAVPFSVSNPILYYNKAAFERAGLDPNKPPTTLDELRADSQQIVSSGAATYGLALKQDPWYFEEWTAMAGQPYADHGNGRDGRATKLEIDNAQGQAIAQWISGMAKDHLAEGTARGGFDNLFALGADTSTGKNIAAMTMDTSAALGTISQVLGSGQYSDVKLGVAPLPGPVAGGGTVVAGSALYMVKRGAPERQEAAFKFATFLASAKSQATWAGKTGYIPIRTDAASLEPLMTTWAQRPDFRVAFDQLQRGADNTATAGPVIGAMEPVRDAIVNAEEKIFQGGDPLAALTGAVSTANTAIGDYESRVGG
jgi:sn-glycerol 3-phosphate transport system substrate-binding protein